LKPVTCFGHRGASAGVKSNVPNVFSVIRPLQRHECSEIHVCVNVSTFMRKCQ